MQKKRLVIVAGTVYPEPSPPGRLALAYADILKERYDIRLLFIQSGLERVDGKPVNDLHLFSVFGLRVFLENLTKKKAQDAKSSTVSKMYNSLSLGMRAMGRLQSMFLFPNNLRWHYKAAYKKLLRLHEEESIDVVFSICSPFSAHLAAQAFKRNRGTKVKWVTYTVDPFSSGEKLLDHAVFKKHKHQLNLRKERAVYEEADFNFISEEIFNTDQSLFQGLMDKTGVLPYFIKKPKMLKEEIYDESLTNAVFAGRFYKDIRNPAFFLKALSLVQIEGFRVHLFAASNCEQLIESYTDEYPNIFIRRALVPSNMIETVLCKADVLLNVGNSITDFKPSKTFEYIATGKPIISFFRNGLRDEVLNRHPYCLQIDEDNTSANEAAQRIEAFINNFGDSKMDWEGIETTYPDFSHGNLKRVLFSVFQ